MMQAVPNSAGWMEVLLHIPVHMRVAHHTSLHNTQHTYRTIHSTHTHTLHITQHSTHDICILLQLARAMYFGTSCMFLVRRARAAQSEPCLLLTWHVSYVTLMLGYTAKMQCVHPVGTYPCNLLLQVEKPQDAS